MTQEYLGRFERLREHMHRAHIDCYVASSKEDIWYLTGIQYSPEERPFFVIVPLEGDITLLVPLLEEAHMQKGILPMCVRTYYDFPSPAGENYYDLLQRLASAYNRVGIESNLPAAQFKYIQTDRMALLDLLVQVKKVKSDYELAQIRFASHYTSAVMEQILQDISPQKTVLDMVMYAGGVQRELTQAGKLDTLNSRFTTCVWPAPESSMPHSIPDFTKTYGAGPIVAMNYYNINGYASECERTLFLQPPTDKERTLFLHMMEARNHALSVLRAGVKTSDVDKAARDYFAAHGLLDMILHRTGHGIGTSNHEAPFLAVGSDEVLAENMVVSIEPGLYDKHIGGFRHSDTVRITKDGYELLTQAPVALEALTRNR